MPKSLICVLMSILVSGCATGPNICKPTAARNAGKSQALGGNAMNPLVGSHCKSEASDTFQSNFEAGYQEGIAIHCTPNTLQKAGISDGEAGLRSNFVEERYTICENTSALATSYRKGYQEGLEKLCSPANARARGYSYGEVGRAMNFEENRHQLCGKDKIPPIRLAFLNGHQQGLSQFCRAESVSKQAFRDGQEGKVGVDTIRTQYQLCGDDLIAGIVSVYEKNHRNGLKEFCSPGKVEEAARNDAEHNITLVLPRRLKPCFSENSKLVEKYKEIFTQQKISLARTQCTYQRGTETGRNDASTSNQKNVGMPPFCDPAYFTTYLNGYLESWMRTKREICNVSGSYDQGIQDGQSGRPISFVATPLCPDELRAEALQKYQEGYRAGQQKFQRHLQSQKKSGCTVEVLKRGGFKDFTRCRYSQGKFACYEGMVENCPDPRTGAEIARKFTRFTGLCVATEEECENP